MLLQRIIQNIGYRQNCCRAVLSTAQIIKNKNVTESISKKNFNQKNWINDEIQKKLKENNLEYFINKISLSIFFKKVSNRTPLYLIDKNVAKQLSAMISKDLLQNPSHVIECNPGFGLLTQELLDAGIPKINLFEKNEIFLESGSPLEKLFTKYKSRLDLKKINFLDIWMLLLHDTYSTETLSQTYLSDIQHWNWDDKTFIQIISICANRAFISLLIYNFFNQSKIFNEAQSSFFLILPYPIWERLIRYGINYLNGRYYNQFTVILNLFFEYTELGSIPRKSVIPWNRRKSNKSLADLDADFIVIKLEPKKNTHLILPTEDLKAYWYFLKHCMRSRKVRIIEEFEKFVPGCGPKLIEKDINICTTFKELSPIDLLELFKIYKSWPEYDRNMFISISLTTDEEKKEDEEKLLSEEESVNNTDVTNQEENRS